MRILVGGGSGFVGSRLICALKERGDEPVTVSRTPRQGEYSWEEVNSEMIAEFDAVINLAGTNVAAHRWTPHYKTEILTSRLRTTSAIVEAITHCDTPPSCFINASAIGYYPLDEELEFDETSEPGRNFLAQVCLEWEQTASLMEGSATRQAIVRFGLILGRGGGAYQRLARLFRLYLGGQIGDGRQPISWIHLEDAVRLLLFILDDPETSGTYNGVAPQWITNRDFTRELAASLHRPASLHTPAWLLNFAMGERAEELLTAGARVVPKRTQESGFQWIYPTLEEALTELAS